MESSDFPGESVTGSRHKQRGHILKQLRMRAGWNQKFVADKIGCKGQYVSHIESGRRPLPKDLYLKWVKLFKITPKSLEEYVRNGTIHSGGHNRYLEQSLEDNSDQIHNLKFSKESQALRQLRNDAKLSLRAAGKLLGVTDSLISHIENGRMAAPTGQRLKKFLKVYGAREIDFKKLVSSIENAVPAKKVLSLMIEKMNDQKAARALEILNRYL